ncbi:DUF7127 family protein [Halopiger thermotolerans]
METPPELEAAAGEKDDAKITNREYEDEQVIAVDFGPSSGEPTLDIAGDTAIVVVGDDQFEFEIPSDATDVTVNDGILTIRG